MPEPSTQRGQATPLLVAVLVLAALCSAGLVRVGIAASASAGAQAAADAAALAGAVGDQAAAAEVAAENGADLLRFEVEGDEVEVEVVRSGAHAQARARWIPSPIP